MLLDVENMVGTNPAEAKLRRQVGRLLQAPGVGGRRVRAAGPTAALVAPAPARCWPLPGSNRSARRAGADAADHALIAWATSALDGHSGTVVVASADGRFARLAGLARLEVIAWDGQSVAGTLPRAAACVHRLPRSPATDAAGHAVSPTPIPGPSVGQPQPTRCRHHRRPAAAPAGRWRQDDAVALVGHGALFGLGMALAARLVDYLVPRPGPTRRK